MRPEDGAAARGIKDMQQVYEAWAFSETSEIYKPTSIQSLKKMFYIQYILIVPKPVCTDTYSIHKLSINQRCQAVDRVCDESVGRFHLLTQCVWQTDMRVKKADYLKTTTAIKHISAGTWHAYHQTHVNKLMQWKQKHNETQTQLCFAWVRSALKG